MEHDSELVHIVRALRGGIDFEANFRSLFERFHPQVHRFFLRKGIPDEESRELAQEVFFSVYKNVSGLKDDNQFTAWLFTIARNQYHSYLQHRHSLKRSATMVASTPENDVDPVASIPDDAPDALQRILDQEKVESLRSALNELPEQMRRCVVMRVLEESPYEEIARRYNLSVNTVKVHLHNARKALSRKLAWYSGVSLP